MSDQSTRLLGVGDFDSVAVGSKGRGIDGLDINCVFGGTEESEVGRLAIGRNSEGSAAVVWEASPVCGL